MDQSREMFDEGVDLILRAWGNEKITFDGKYWQVPEPIEVLPKPVQLPHPPIYQAAISAESFDNAAKPGWSVQLAAPSTYRTYREEWIPPLAAELRPTAKKPPVHAHPPENA